MLRTKKLDDHMTAAFQITAHDVPAIAAAGFTCIMCNRPHNEERGQPDWDEIVAAARAHGLETRYVPMGSRAMNARALEDFKQVLREVEGPIFAFCRTGTRCEILWRAAQAG